MKKTALSIAAAVLALSATMARAETVWTVSSWLPPKHPIVTEMIIPWGENVKKATDGRVGIKILAKGLGHPKIHYDIARDGLADVTYGVHGYTPGRFVMTKSVEFPFLSDSAEALSVAYWRVHEKYLAGADEHKDVKLLGVFTHGPGAIHNSKRDIKSVADMQGLKFRVGGGVVNDVAKALGTTPLLKPASKNYELLSHGVADGTLLPMESIKSFKITALVPHTTAVPGGLYNVSFFLTMNQGKFDALSADDQAAVMSVSGEAFAKLAGKAWDAVDAAGIAAMKEAGNSVMTADQAMIDEIASKTSHLETDWIVEAKKRGVDGEAVMKELRDIVKNYQ